MRFGDFRGVADDDDEDGGQQTLSAAVRWQQARRIMPVMYFASLRQGMNAYTLYKLKGSKLDQRRSQEQLEFISHVLSSPALMRKCSKALKELHRPLFADGVNNEKAFAEARMEVFNLASKVIHEVKTNTATSCWIDEVVPLKGQLADATAKLTKLNAQFKEARAMYLSELSLLRDQVRPRTDPAPDLCMDVKWFYEPTKTLMDEERAALLLVVREKLKMICETNPEVAKGVDFSQIQRLASEVDTAECGLLRKELEQKSAQIVDLEMQVRMLMRGHAPAQEAPRSGPPSAATERMIDMLEEQLGKVRSDYQVRDLEYRKVLREAECAAQERDELADFIKQENAQRLLAQQELEKVSAERDKMTETLTALKSDMHRMEESLHAEERKCKVLQKKFDAQKQATTRAATSALHVGGANAANGSRAPSRVPSRAPSPTREGTDPGSSPASGGSPSLGVSGTQLVDAPGPEMPPCIPDDSEAKNQLLSMVKESEEAEKSAEEARRIALREKEEAEKKCAELQEMVHKLIEGDAQRRNQVDVQAAEDAEAWAESLGCGVSTGTGEQIRACACGNILMPDSAFCRKCGAEWHRPRPKAERKTSTADELATRVGDLAEALTQANQQLQSVLKECGLDTSVAETAGGTGGTDHQVTSTTLEGGSGGPTSRWSEDVARAQQEVSRLQREKHNAEARLLVQISEDTLITHSSESCSLDAPCDGSCKLTISNLQKLLKQVRRLCTELTMQLKSTVLENLDLTKTLSAVQGKLKVAAEALVADDEEQRQVGLKALWEAQHRSVFYRLYQDARRRTENSAKMRELERQKIRQETYEQLQFMRTSTITNGSKLLELTKKVIASNEAKEVFTRESPEPSPKLPVAASSLRHKAGPTLATPAICHPEASQPDEKDTAGDGMAVSLSIVGAGQSASTSTSTSTSTSSSAVPSNSRRPSIGKLHLARSFHSGDANPGGSQQPQRARLGVSATGNTPASSRSSRNPGLPTLTEGLSGSNSFGSHAGAGGNASPTAGSLASTATPSPTPTPPPVRRPSVSASGMPAGLHKRRPSRMMADSGQGASSPETIFLVPSGSMGPAKSASTSPQQSREREASLSMEPSHSGTSSGHGSFNNARLPSLH